MRDLRYYQPILRLIERGFTPYSKNIRAILTLIIILVAVKNARRKVLFLITGAVSLSLALLRLISVRSGFLNPYVAGIVMIATAALSAILWFIATFGGTHHYKLDYSFTSDKILPFFGFLNIFLFYAVIGGRAVMYSALALFVIAFFIYFKAVFVKKMNYPGKEFLFWNLYDDIPADELLFPIEDSDKLQKYKITLQDDTRNAIVSPHDSRFFSKPIQISRGDYLVFSIGLAEKVFSGICIFEIYASVDRGPEERIFSHYLSPVAKMVDRTWKDFKIDLAHYDGKELVLSFKTHIESKTKRIDAYWEFPKIIHNKVTISHLPSANTDIENVIVLVMDGMRADLFQRVLSMPDGMPNTSRFFFQNSIHCDRAISQSDWSVPAITSIFSGRYASYHQHFVSRPLSYDRPLFSELEWLPKILREKGYLTHAFLDSGEFNAQYGFTKGFDSFYNGENFDGFDYGEKISFHGLRFLRENEGRKKFLFLHSCTTHRPFRTRYPYRVSSNPNFSSWFNHELFDSFLNTPYEKLREEDKQAIVDSYSTGIAQMDRELSVIFDYLTAKQQDGRSLVILTTDHGSALFERDAFCPKVTALYDEIIHIPLLIRVPEGALKNASPEVIDSLIEANVDIFPTVLDAIGIKEAVPLNGHSLLKLVKGDISPRAYTVSELHDTKSDTYMLAIRGERYKLIAIYKFDALRPFTFKTARRVGEMFFDLVSDPSEKKDISKERHEIFLQYREIEEEFSGL